VLCITPDKAASPHNLPAILSLIHLLTSRQIFEYSQQLEKDGWTFKMQVSMLEIYNEEYRDLLGGDPKPETKLQVRQLFTSQRT
jgi:hypothetical protein